MIDKNYYNKLFKNKIEEISKTSYKPTLLLHACCGPCLTYPLSILKDYFKITVLYLNPNIMPNSEYLKRYLTLKRFIEEYSKDNNFELNLVKYDDDFKKYSELFKDRINDKEGGEVCLRCHYYRMNLSYEYANINKFDYFTTVMTVSSKKPSYEINKIGEDLSKIYTNTQYLFSDFKKDDGQLKGIKICKQYNLYRQDYCGCMVSFNERHNVKNENLDNMIG